MSTRITAETPDRWGRPGLLQWLAYVVVAAVIVSSLSGAEISLTALLNGLPRMADMLVRMLPPDLERLEPLGRRLIETLQMAVAGTFIGTVLSLPLAILATRHLTPNLGLYYLARAIIAFSRTVPDLVWALFFVIAVGLGPFAGTLALVMDTIGFSARFFAEAMEEVDRGPQEALTALGASRTGVIASAVIPAALPAMINTTLFALEKAVRSSVVLGLVGAGGIGIELKVAMDMFQYDQAATIILLIFALVLLVERLSAYCRQKVLRGD